MVLLTGVNDHNRRLDRILRRALPECPLALIHKLLRKGLILLNGKPASAQTRVAKGSKITIPRLSAGKIAKKTISKSPVKLTQLKPQSQPLPKPMPEPQSQPQPEPLLSPKPMPEPQSQPQPEQSDFQPPSEPKLEPPPQQPEPKAAPPVSVSVPVSFMEPKAVSSPAKSSLSVRFFHPPEVLWQTNDLIAFNKPVGLAVHGHVSLDRMVKAYLVNKLPPSLSFKPGPLHRLDKPSSGIVVFSASLEGANLFSNLMKEQKIKKTYKAIVEGTMEGKHFWTDYLVRDKERKKTFITESDKGKVAITMVMPIAAAKIMDKHYTLIEAEIETGRTHQIRAQSGFHGYPLAGDRKYGGRVFKGGFYLHACKMEFLLNNIMHKIEAPLPAEFQKLVDTVFC